MRFLIKFSRNTTPVSVINQHLVNNYIYQKCLKDDELYHDAKNDYCISHLYGGKLNPETKTINFPNGALIAITSEDEIFLNKIIQGVIKNPEFTHGMKFETFDFVSEKIYDGYNYFATLSPFILRKTISKKEYKFVVIEDEKFFAKANPKTKERVEMLSYEKFSEFLTEYEKNKIQKLYPNLNLEDVKIEVKKNPSNKIKVIFKEFDHMNKRNVMNFANQCYVTIYGNKKAVEKIYNIGLGQSTGCGFGTIYKTENHHIYKKS